MFGAKAPNYHQQHISICLEDLFKVSRSKLPGNYRKVMSEQPTDKPNKERKTRRAGQLDMEELVETELAD